MRVTRHAAAPGYQAAAHHGVATLRLQGHEAGPTDRFWVGLSCYLPGGGADETPAGEETVYVVLDGNLVVQADGKEEELGPLDSVHLPKGTRPPGGQPVGAPGHAPGDHRDRPPAGGEAASGRGRPMSAIITVATTGPIATKADNPALPTTPEEIAAEVAAAYLEGAAVAHVHLRDERQRPTADLGIARQVMELIAARCPILVQLSTGVGLDVAYEERARLVELRPRMATLNPCSMSFGLASSAILRWRYAGSRPGCGNSMSSQSLRSTTPATWMRACGYTRKTC